MEPQETVSVTRADFISVGKKLEQFISQLSSQEQGVMTGLMELAAGLPAWWQPQVPAHFKYKPRGAKYLVFGGADGLTVLIGRSGIVVIHPEGPLPTDFSPFLGASLVVGQVEHEGV